MKPTLTIGIAAYNEEKNIGHLLQALRMQKISSAKLEGIVVVSDSSTDRTDEIVRKIEGGGVRLVRMPSRQGGAMAQNAIFAGSKSDIVVVLDADIMPADDSFIDSLISPIILDPEIGLTSNIIEPAKPRTFVEKALARNHVFKTNLWLSSGMGNTIYTCFGPARAFSRKLYEGMRYPKDVPVDSYSYMHCVSHGLKFALARSASVIFRCPENFSDHRKQSTRFMSGKDAIVSVFGDAAKAAYRLPFWPLFLSSLKELVSHPILFMAFILMSVRIRLGKHAAFSSKWDMAGTSKNVISEKSAATVRQRIYISSYDDVHNPYYAGGGAIAVHEVAKRLSGSFDITVITANYPGAKGIVKDGVSYKRIGPSFGGPFGGQLLFHALLPFYVLTEKYDLWMESFTPPFSTSFLPLFTSKPVIGLVHMLSAKNMARKYYLPFEIIENIGLKLYSRLIVLTEADAKKLQTKNPRISVAVIGNGVHLPASAADVSSIAGKTLSFVGRIEIDQKGLDLLLEAYAHVRTKLDLPLVIAGTGSLSQMGKLRRLISRHKLSDHVRLAGWVENGEKEKIFLDTAVGLAPSRYETFSLSALEMMSYGIPSVAFDIPGLSWTGNDTILKVKPFDARALGDAIMRLLGDAGERQRIGANARAYTLQNSWDACAQKYEDFISLSLLK